MKRRAFLLMIGLGIVTLPIQGKTDIATNGAINRKISPGTLKNVLSIMFTDTANAIFVGQQYLKKYPDSNHLELLIRDAGLDFHFDMDNYTDLVEQFFRRHQCDFENSNTVLVENWVLSRAEASLCGIMALS